jgi:hypothetical protein
MALKPSDIQVTLEVKGGLSVSVTMTFRNTSGDKGYIYKMLAPVDGELSQNLFRIRGPAGPVSYKGPVMKLAAPTPKDFIEIAPGASLECTVKLAESYAFPAGGGTFKVHYFAVNSFPTGNQLRKLESNEVTFRLVP